MRIVPVLLSGGIGSRLWPLSTAALPKQLQRLTGTNTMIQATALRLSGMQASDSPIVVCGADHAEVIRGQLREVGIDIASIVAEPVGRNTAAAIVAAAIETEGDSVMVVLPSDAVIADLDAFSRAAKDAVEEARRGALVTFGIVPDRPETGYGYIEVADRSAGPVLPVEAFVEKPDAETASRYVAGGRHFWNGGMFAFTARTVCGEFERFAPDILEAVTDALRSGSRRDRIVRLGDEFASVRSISFDHAIMEHTDRAMVVPLAAGWSDVGSWSTLWEIGEKDGAGNVIQGDVTTIDVRDSLVRAESRSVAVVGLDEVVVVETPDAVLVMRKDRAQDVKEILNLLETTSGNDGE